MPTPPSPQYSLALPRPSVSLLIGGAAGQAGQLGRCGGRERLHRRRQGGETTLPRLTNRFPIQCLFSCSSVINIFVKLNVAQQSSSYPKNETRFVQE